MQGLRFTLARSPVLGPCLTHSTVSGALIRSLPSKIHILHLQSSPTSQVGAPQFTTCAVEHETPLGSDSRTTCAEHEGSTTSQAGEVSLEEVITISLPMSHVLTASASGRGAEAHANEMLVDHNLLLQATFAALQQRFLGSPHKTTSCSDGQISDDQRSDRIHRPRK